MKRSIINFLDRPSAGWQLGLLALVLSTAIVSTVHWANTGRSSLLPPDGIYPVISVKIHEPFGLDQIELISVEYIRNHQPEYGTFGGLTIAADNGSENEFFVEDGKAYLALRRDFIIHRNPGWLRFLALTALILVVGLVVWLVFITLLSLFNYLLGEGSAEDTTPTNPEHPDWLTEAEKINRRRQQNPLYQVGQNTFFENDDEGGG